MNTSIPLSDLSTPMLIALGALIVIQMAVLVIALTKLMQTPDERLMFGKKWPWIIIILFVNLIGGLVFLAVGRKPAVVADPLASSQDDAERPADRAERAADVLYGSKDGE